MLQGTLAVINVELRKLAAQYAARIVLVLCAIAPFGFVSAMRVQSSLPEDTTFGRLVIESGFATPLVVLGFSTLWVLPVLASVVGGDLFAAEDRYGTWATLLTRSRSRAEVFWGKVLAALGFASVAVATLAVASTAAGVLVVGAQPLVSLTGTLVFSEGAMARIALAWASVLPPTCAFVALAVLTSVATRNSAAGIGLPVVLGLIMQLCAYVDGPDVLRRLLITSSFEAWHGLWSEPPYLRPLADGIIVSVVYMAAALSIAFRMMRRRDIGR